MIKIAVFILQCSCTSNDSTFSVDPQPQREGTNQTRPDNRIEAGHATERNEQSSHDRSPTSGTESIPDDVSSLEMHDSNEVEDDHTVAGSENELIAGDHSVSHTDHSLDQVAGYDGELGGNRAGIDQDGAGIDQDGAGIDQDGAGIDQDGAGIDELAGNTTGGSMEDPSNPIVMYSSTRRHLKQFNFTYDRSVTAGNPLKGMITNYQWSIPANDFPLSMEFAYFPLAELMSGPEQFTFETSFEDQLLDAQNRGHHSVIRVYIDYPGLTSGMPEYLQNLVQCSPYQEYGGGCSPEYEDPDFQSALINFIHAFGERYDGDQRIAFIQVGLLGFWGEWHTYPHIDWFATDQVQQAVITAFDTAFTHTPIQLRIPAQDSASRHIGYHDDSFGRSTLGDIAWYFWPRVVAANAQNQWLLSPMGGEIYPPYQLDIFTDRYSIDDEHQAPISTIQSTHMTYLLNYQAFNLNGVGYQGEQRNRAEQASNTMGYEFTINQISIEAKSLNHQMVDLKVTIEWKNSGIAPFYYPLSIKLSMNHSEFEHTIEINSANGAPSNQYQLSTFELRNIRVEALSQGIELTLDSPQLLEGQMIRWANIEDQDGILHLNPSFHCENSHVTLQLAESMNHAGSQCFCDVDGQLYTVNGVQCIL